MKFEKSNKSNFQISMVPLINVIFLLLIFFIVAGTLESPDRFKVEIPHAQTGELIEDKSDEKPIILTLDRDDQIIYNDKKVSAELLDIVLLHSIRKKPERLIHIKADASLSASKLVGLIRKLSEAGALNLSIASNSDIS